MELGNSEAIKHAVRHGLGISCLSRRVIAEQLEVGSLVELTVPLPRLTARCGGFIIGRSIFQGITTFSALLPGVNRRRYYREIANLLAFPGLVLY
jgi:DNA-binding transcriptional LysR family regulator